MSEMKNVFTNPFNIKCNGCGAPAEYDIIHQNYHCQFCGSVTDLQAPLRAVERYRKLHEQELKVRNKKEKLRKYHCPNCGAVVVLDTTEATAKCGFCDTKMVNSKFVDSDAFPELIIPFKLTLDEAKAELEKWLKKNSSKEEAKKLEGRVDELKGYYLPYYVVKGPVRGTVSRARSLRQYNYGGFIDEVAVNTSSQLDNMLLDAMEPFDWSEIHPFEYGFIAGMPTKLQDTDAKAISSRIYTEIRATYLETIEKTLQSADLSTSLNVDNVMQIPALMPVYVITLGRVQCAVNGQTGRVSVTPLKETTVQRAWLEPVLIVLFIAGLCELVPLLLNFHPSYEITAMMSVIVGLIVWTAYQGTSTVKRIVYLQSDKQLAKRVNERITYTDGKELVDNPAKQPVFFEELDGVIEPVKVSFYSGSRAVKAGIFAIVGACLPNILALLSVAFNVYIGGDPVESFDKLNHFSAAAWWTLMVPVMFILWIAIVRRDVFDHPILHRILPDGSTEKVKGLNKLDLDIKDIVGMMFTSPFCWIALFLLFLLLGSLGAILDF